MYEAKRTLKGKKEPDVPFKNSQRRSRLSSYKAQPGAIVYSRGMRSEEGTGMDYEVGGWMEEDSCPETGNSAQ